MSIADEDRVLGAIKLTLNFYGKKPDDMQLKFWRRWVRGQNNTELVLEALRQYPNTGKFAPKPADIQAIIEEIRPPKSSYREQELEDTCPPEIRAAWMHWVPKFWDQPLPFKEGAEPVSDSQAEAWLILVNQEAKRCNTPEAIPETHKLQEIWA